MTRNLATFGCDDGGPRRRHPLTDGTTAIVTPSARRVGALLRSRDLDRCSLLAALGAERGGAVQDAECGQRQSEPGYQEGWRA